MHRRKEASSLLTFVGAAAAAAIIVSPSSALAQVLEVGPSGVTVVTSGAVMSTARGAPVAPRAGPARKPAAPPSAGPLLKSAGEATDLSPRLLEAIAYVESRFRTDAVSPKGAVGMMQLMPKTAAELGVDPHKPAENARGGADYLRRMLAQFGDNVEWAIAAYNAGPEAVHRHGGVPPYPETRAYVAAVMDYLARTSLPETP